MPAAGGMGRVRIGGIPGTTFRPHRHGLLASAKADTPVQWPGSSPVAAAPRNDTADRRRRDQQRPTGKPSLLGN